MAQFPDEFWLDQLGEAVEGQEERHVYSVSQLTGDIRLVLEDNFTPVWVAGEISTLRTPVSGHCYFTLKDERSQLKAVFFRQQRFASAYRLQEGDLVLCRGRISLYEPRGEYQMIVSRLEPQGLGELWRAFAALKAKLESEGLFRPERKKAIPLLPRTLALVTSPTGAAVHDILQVIGRRFAGVEIIVVPVVVQGERAAGEICAALERLERYWRERVDTIILARGGGSYEDLQPFNDERVARAIAAGSIPLISAVGHEIDFTIADFVADLRAPTPSAAAEMVIGSRREMVDRLHHLRRRLLQSGRLQTTRERRRLQMLALGLDRGAGSLLLSRRRLLELKARFFAGLRHRLRLVHQQLATREHCLRQVSPGLRLDSLNLKIETFAGRLQRAWSRQLHGRKIRLAAAGDRLRAGNPLAVLARGYAVVEKTGTGVVVRNCAELHPGELLDLRFHQGGARCRVERVIPFAPERMEKTNADE